MDAFEDVRTVWEHLDQPAGDRLRGLAWALTTRSRWEGLDGLVVTPEMQGCVAAWAAILSLNVGDRVFTDVTSILIAPMAQTRVSRVRRGDGMVSEIPGCVMGEALIHGPVRLAWDRVRADRTGCRSVVIHEFAHKFDMVDGIVDGEPGLPRAEARAWQAAIGAAGEDPDPVVMPEYAWTNDAEFFACATEAFFLSTAALKRRYPELFEVLRGVYRQDPVPVRPCPPGSDA